MENEAPKKWSDKYVILCAVVTWLCMFGPLLSYFVAFHIMGMDAHSPVIDFGEFGHTIRPLIWPAIFGGLLAPFVGLITGSICLRMMKVKRRVYFPFGICVLWILCFVGFIVRYNLLRPY